MVGVTQGTLPSNYANPTPTNKLALNPTPSTMHVSYEH